MGYLKNLLIETEEPFYKERKQKLQSQLNFYLSILIAHILSIIGIVFTLISICITTFQIIIIIIVTISTIIFLIIAIKIMCNYRKHTEPEREIEKIHKANKKL